MIIFHKARFKNILSYGNQFTELQLDKSTTTLISGKNGAGKCLDKSTKITIQFDTLAIRDLFESYVVSNLDTATIGDIVSFYATFPALRGTIKVKTRFGYKPILAAQLTARQSKVLRIYTRCGKILKVSPDHLLLSTNEKWVKAKTLTEGMPLYTENGQTDIIDIMELKDHRDLYDLQVESVNEFYANGIVSHNSAILEVLCFTLFGKSFRKINKPQLVNTKNKKDLLCEIEFTKNGISYLIRRGINPAIFEVFKDGVLLNQNAASRDYQENFEKNILQFDYHIFTQIVVLGRAIYTSFMKLTPDQRRKFIENILGLNVFSFMNEIHKQNVVVLKDELTKIKHHILLTKDKIEIRESYIKTLESDVKIKQTIVIEKIEEKIAIVQSEIDILTTEIAELDAQKPDVDLQLQVVLQNRQQQLNNLIMKSTSKYDRLTRDLVFIQNNLICPSCNQLIDETVKLTREQELKLKLDEISDMMQTIEQKINHTTDQLDDLNETLQKQQIIAQRLSIINAATNEKQKQIMAFEKEKTVHLFDDVDKISEEYIKLDELNNAYSIALSTKSDLLDKFEHYELVSALLKDGGIKSTIIRKYIPIINNFTNKFLKDLGFFIRFEMNEEFEETLFVRGFDALSYSNLSEGEKLRIDLAIMMMWREIAKLQNNMNTNLLVLDEITEASADQAGTEAFIDLLNRQQDMNIFVISHNTDRWTDKFRSSIIMTKEGGFSTMRIKG